MGIVTMYRAEILIAGSEIPREFVTRGIQEASESNRFGENPSLLMGSKLRGRKMATDK